MTKVFTPGTDNAVLIPVSAELLFKGRPGDPRLGEWVLTKEPPPAPLGDAQNCVFLLGCPDDTGVRLNLGRAGAQLGPQEIRRAFYKMALPGSDSWKLLRVFDRGNIPISDSIEETHQHALEAASDLAALGGTLILLGGGHDFAAPGFLGFAKGRLKSHPLEKFGLINIDPHLDVRPRENGKPHSGTPFRDILDSGLLEGRHLVQFGCRENRNAESHFEFCQKAGVNLQRLEQLRQNRKSIPELFKGTLEALCKKVSRVGVSIDLDSCAEVTGTSAAPAIGFSIRELYEMATIAGTFSQVNYFELAEVAPSLDPTGKTPVAAAEILYSFLNGKTHSTGFADKSSPSKNFRKTLKNIKTKSKTK